MQRHPTPANIAFHIAKAIGEYTEEQKALPVEQRQIFPIEAFSIIDAAISAACDEHDKKKVEAQ